MFIKLVLPHKQTLDEKCKIGDHEDFCASNCAVMEGYMCCKWKSCSDLKGGQNRYFTFSEWWFGIYC